jgi:hypothetical protein
MQNEQTTQKQTYSTPTVVDLGRIDTFIQQGGGGGDIDGGSVYIPGLGIFFPTGPFS